MKNSSKYISTIYTILTLIVIAGCKNDDVKTPNAEYTISRAIYDTAWNADRTAYTTSLNHYDDNVTEAKLGQPIKIKRTSGNASMTVVWLGDSLHDYYKQNYNMVVKTKDKTADSIVVKRGNAFAWMEEQDSAIYDFPYASDDPILQQKGKAPEDGYFKIVIISTNAESGAEVSHNIVEKRLKITGK